MPDIDMSMWSIVVVVCDGAVEPFRSHGYSLSVSEIESIAQYKLTLLHPISIVLQTLFSILFLLSLWLLQQQRWNTYHRLQDNHLPNHFLTPISPKYSLNAISLRLKTCLQRQRQDTNHFILHSSMHFVISFFTPYNSAISYTLLVVRFIVQLNMPCANGLTQAIV